MRFFLVKDLDQNCWMQCFSHVPWQSLSHGVRTNAQTVSLDNFLMTSLSSLVYMYYFDNPGGMIPSWLVNWAAKVSKAWWCNYLCLLCLNNLFTASKPVFCMLSRIYVCKYVYVDIYTCIYIFFWDGCIHLPSSETVLFF